MDGNKQKREMISLLMVKGNSAPPQGITLMGSHGK
jgi:hypothetical protein